MQSATGLPAGRFNCTRRVTRQPVASRRLARLQLVSLAPLPSPPPLAVSSYRVSARYHYVRQRQQQHPERSVHLSRHVVCPSIIFFACLFFFGGGGAGGLKPRFWGNPTQKPSVKNIFRAHFETYSKPRFVAYSSFWYRCQNDLQKYFFTLGF